VVALSATHRHPERSEEPYAERSSPQSTIAFGDAG
jgi:hypothetical protein